MNDTHRLLVFPFGGGGLGFTKESVDVIFPGLLLIFGGSDGLGIIEEFV